MWPPDPLDADEALAARSAALFMARRDRVAAVDAAVAALAAEGKLRPDQLDYAALHRFRFAEAAEAIARFAGAPAAGVAEIGSSITPLLYARLFPQVRLHAACLFRHPQLDGVVADAVQLDLEKVDLRAGPALPFRGLRMVLLCEVLEHLVVNPSRLFASLAGSLASGGFLYVTTPNLLRRDSRAKWAAGRNPQPIYPAEYGPADRFHFHVREYAMVELLEAVSAAGLLAEAAYYSDCWDSPAEAAGLPRDEWRNLVVLARKA